MTDASHVRQEPPELTQKELDLSKKEDFCCQVQVSLKEGLLKTRVNGKTQQSNHKRTHRKCK